MPVGSLLMLQVLNRNPACTSCLARACSATDAKMPIEKLTKKYVIYLPMSALCARAIEVRAAKKIKKVHNMPEIVLSMRCSTEYT
mmetsp:Transcript_23647/g.34679  ORF Transcript_23647/g.34679 Transcript_23647/m.34679 type:complete len:85 (-) Transcript_23647:145-399(-)